MLRTVCVFCGSSAGKDAAYVSAAQEMGRLLAARKIRLVYGGGKVGMMGALADACLGAGGQVTGVIPRLLVDKEIAHRGLSDLRVVGSMHERKALMAELGDAFVAMPGGFGTWEEFCEVLTWTQLGLLRKPCAVLNVNGYYDPLLAMADRAVEDEFVREVHRRLVLADHDAGRLLNRMETYSVPFVDKWLDPSGS